MLMSIDPLSRSMTIFTLSLFRSALPFVVLISAIAFWIFRVSGQFSSTPLLIIIYIVVICALIGRLLSDALIRVPNMVSFSGAFLIGALVANSLLLMGSFLSPFGLIWNWLFISTATLGFALKKKWQSDIPIFASQAWADSLIVLFACSVITIWCWDLLHPMQINSQAIAFKAWGDIFYHMSQMNVFSRMSDFRLESDILSSELPFRLYHYASYLLPSLLAKASGLNSFAVYAGLLVPLGLLLLCFSAYFLASLIFGSWAGLFAAMALFLLPDAFHQGWGNLFLGQFHWLIQASPAMSYGVACAALVFSCIFLFYREQKIRFVVIAYVFVMMTLLFKSQIFVAISLPALILPILIYQKINLFQKGILIVICLAIYVGIITFANSMPNFPPIRLNGQGFIPYTHWLNDIQAPGLLKNILNSSLVLNHRLIQVIVYVGFVLVTSMGWALAIYPLVLKSLSHKVGLSVALFPVLIISIYLVMALGLALNDSEVGLPEELLHRPFIWTYFILTVWTAAGLYLWAVNRQKLNGVSKYYPFALISLFILFPLNNYENIQGHTQSSQIQLPLCQYQSAQFIKENLNSQEVFQDSNVDTAMILTALSAKPEFVVNFLGTKVPKLVQKRTLEIERLGSISDPQAIIDYMKTHRIAYFAFSPNAHLIWERALSDRRVFECEGYRIYQFR
jgi:hypothetical protein